MGGAQERRREEARESGAWGWAAAKALHRHDLITPRGRYRGKPRLRAGKWPGQGLPGPSQTCPPPPCVNPGRRKEGGLSPQKLPGQRPAQSPVP